MSYRKPFLTLASILALLGPTAAMAENLQGNAKGFKTRQILLSTGAPLLQSFYFRFTDQDHHFGGMEVQPNAPTANQMKYGFSDKNGDDGYFYNITWAPYFGQIFRASNEREFCRSSGCTFRITRPTNIADPVFVLRGFYIHFRNGDHHLKRIAITESNGSVTVALRDKNTDDHLAIDLHYAYIPRASIASMATASGNDAGGARRTIPAGHAAIRGFDFNFASGDRHIRDIGVQISGSGRLEVFYGDKTPNDRFAWKVNWAVLR